MKLRVMPIYGHGWTAPDASPIDVPDEFPLDAVESPEGFVKGRVSKTGHPLDGYWLILSQRHVAHDGCYNLSAYHAEPTSIASAVADIAGFAQTEPIGP